MKKWFIPCTSLILLIGCSDTEQNGQSDAPATEEPDTTENNEETENQDDPEQETVALTEIAANLEIPWSINKIGDEFYIAAQNGKLYVASLGGTAINVIDLKPGDVIDTIDGFGRIRDVHIEGDDLYFITNNTDGRGNPAEDDDKLYRLPIGG